MKRTETEALLRRLSDALNASDRLAAQSCLADDVTIELRHDLRWIGREGFGALLAGTIRHFEGRIADLVVMSDESGVHGAAEFTLRGRYLATLAGYPAASGQNISLAAGAFIEVDAGHISRITLYFRDEDLVRELAEG